MFICLCLSVNNRSTKSVGREQAAEGSEIVSDMYGQGSEHGLLDLWTSSLLSGLRAGNEELSDMSEPHQRNREDVHVIDIFCIYYLELYTPLTYNVKGA